MQCHSTISTGRNAGRTVFRTKLTRAPQPPDEVSTARMSSSSTFPELVLVNQVRRSSSSLSPTSPFADVFRNGHSHNPLMLQGGDAGQSREYSKVNGNRYAISVSIPLSELKP